MKNIFNFIFKELNFDQIDFTFTDFTFSYPLKTDYFLKLLKEGKPFYPPILYKGVRGYLIVDGFARLFALKTLNFQPVKVLILENTFSMKDLLLISLELNLPRGLNLVEKALFLEKGEKYFSRDELIEILPRLGLSKHQNWIFYFKKILNFEEPIKELLAIEKLNPKIIDSLALLDPKDREDFLNLIEKLHLTISEQRETLEVLLDYKRLTKSSKLLPEEIKKTLEIKDFNKRRKEFFEILNQMKYPNFYQKKKHLEKVRRLFLSYGIKVDFYPYLEKEEINLQFNVKNIEELEKILKYLENEGNKIFSFFE